MVDSDDPSPHVMSCQEDMDDLEAVDMQSQHLVWFGKVSVDYVIPEVIVIVFLLVFTSR